LDLCTRRLDVSDRNRLVLQGRLRRDRMRLDWRAHSSRVRWLRLHVLLRRWHWRRLHWDRRLRLRVAALAQRIVEGRNARHR
jgi:hypothetical protein